MVAAALLRIRSIVRANPRLDQADATDSEPVEDGVAPGRAIGRPGQIGSERGHAAASRVREVDLNGRRLRLSGSGADKTGQDNRSIDNAHWHGSPILRTSVVRARTHGHPLGRQTRSVNPIVGPEAGSSLTRRADGCSAEGGAHNRKASADSHGCSAFSVRRLSARVRPRLTAASGFPRLAARWTKRKPE
jgi:hypothetical protein